MVTLWSSPQESRVRSSLHEAHSSLALLPLLFIPTDPGRRLLPLLFITLSFGHVAASRRHHWPSALCSNLSESSLSSAWHCLPHATPPPQLRRSPLLAGDHRLKPGRITDTRCLCVWCFAGTPSAQEMLSAFFPPSRSVAQSWALQPNPVTIPEHSWLIPTTACYRFPQTTRLCYNFRLAGAAWIELWTSKAVYGRTEEFKLYNRQLPCPLTPSPPFNLWSIRRWVLLGAD